MNNKTNITDTSNCFSQEFLLKYVNNELSNAENLIVENHIKHCDICSDIVDGLLLMENPDDILGIAAGLNIDIDSKIKKKKRILGMNTVAFRAVAAIFLLLLVSGSFLFINNMLNNVQIDKVEEFSQIEGESFEESNDPIYTAKENTNQVADAVAQEKSLEVDDNEFAESKTTKIIKEYFEEEENTIDRISTKDSQSEKSAIIDEVTDKKTNAAGFAAVGKDINPTGTSLVKLETTSLDDDTSLKADAAEGNGLINISATRTVNVESVASNRKQEKKFNKGNRSLQKSKEPISQNKNSEVESDESVVLEYPEGIIESLIVVDNMDAELDNRDEPIAFAAVEQKPEFHNGDSALMSYVAKNFEYPEGLKELGLSGRIYVKFTINNIGKVINVQVVRGIHPKLDAEAVRVVKNMPDWIPAKQNGKPVAVNYILPIKIK